MSILRRPAYWIAALVSMALVYGSIYLVSHDLVPGVFVPISVGAALLVMVSALAYVAVTNSYKNYDAQQNESNEVAH